MAYKNKQDERKKQHECYLRSKNKYKARVKKQNKVYKTRNRDYFNEYKINHGCCKCGYKSNAVALDFHHIDTYTKDANIARLINSSWSIEKILQEVKKCVVICANCHRVEHNKEKPYDMGGRNDNKI